MTSPNLSMLQGSFISEGTIKLIELPFTPTKFEIFNKDAFNLSSNPGVTKRAWWFTGLDDLSAFTVRNTNSASTDQSDFITVGGFTFIDPSTRGAPLVDTAVTGATDASPVVVTMSSDHSLTTGDRVVFSDTTGMLQITDQVWQVTVTGAATFSITAPGADFSAAATEGFVRKAFPSEYQPQKVYVQAITKASSAVVTTSYDHGYSVDEVITMHVPEFWGMTEMEGLQGRITAVTANTFTLDINSSAFTTFKFPTSAETAAGVGTAHAVNIGIEQSNATTDSLINEARRGMLLGSSIVGLADEELFWTAWSAEGNNIVV